MNTKTASLAIGDTFALDVEKPYTVDGVKNVHAYTNICEVVAFEEAGFSYKVTEVTNEKNRPSFASTPVSGSIAWFVLPIYIERGTLRVG